VAYITSSIVRHNQEASAGHCSAKHVIPEIRDAIAEFVRSGPPYQLMPRPAPGRIHAVAIRRTPPTNRLVTAIDAAFPNLRVLDHSVAKELDLAAGRPHELTEKEPGSRRHY
jgi:hypothetical protein